MTSLTTTASTPSRRWSRLISGRLRRWPLLSGLFVTRRQLAIVLGKALGLHFSQAAGDADWLFRDGTTAFRW